MKHTSYIELNKRNLTKNLRFLHKIIGKDVLFSSVIKSNAYGHGICEYVQMAKSCGLKHFAVFSAGEAHEVIEAEAHHDATIMIMGYLETAEMEWAIQNEIEIFIFNLERLQEAIRISKLCGKKVKIHLEIETGLNRTGIDRHELEQTIKLIKYNIENLELKGLCTHLAGAESIGNYIRIQEQIKNYEKIKKNLQRTGLNFDYYHQASSAGIFTYPNSIGNMVRVGIAQYGFWPSQEVRMSYLVKNKTNTDPLKRVISWKSRIMEIKTVEQGDYVGYGSSYMAPKKIKIATIPVGYAYGYSRSLSNLGRVLINGKRLAVIGTVNMNMIAVNVTDLKNVALGDDVILIGKQGKHEVTVSSFGELSNQLNYELLSRIPQNIPRNIIDK